MQLAGGDRDRAAERVTGGKGDRAGSGLGDATGAGKDAGDRAGAQAEVGGRRKAAGGTGDGARIQGDDTSRLDEAREIEGAAADRHGSRIGEHFIAAQGEGAGVDVGTARVGVSRVERELAVADLGESGGGIGRGKAAEGHRSSGAATADKV